MTKLLFIKVVEKASRFITADRYLVATPMWNGGISYRLKLENKHATLVLTAGAYAQSLPSPAFGVDLQSTYLRAWLNQAGVTAIDEVRFQPSLLTQDPEGDFQQREACGRRARHGARVAPITRGSQTLKTRHLGAVLASAESATPAPIPSTAATTTYHRTQVDGVHIVYREAGPKDAPTIVLLHGFPSSSREFDTLIPLLATRYHLIAPDFPGFGQSDAPPPSEYRYTFDHIAKTMDDLLDQLKVDSYTLYIHDYGAPVGMRMILAHPGRLHALISQNGNIYQEGLGPKWSAIAQFWADPTAHPEVVDAFLSYEATEQRHTASVRRIPSVITRTRGPTSSPTCQSPDSVRSRRRSSTTTGPTSRRIRNGRRGCASTVRPRGSPGVPTIRPLSLRAQRRSSAICQTPRSIWSMRAISRSTRRTMKSPA